MTTANKITILRSLMVPFFIVQMIYYVTSGDERHWLAALFSFAIAAISDGLDGYIARRYNQRSELGAVLDPLADKLLLVSGVVILSFNNAPYLLRIPSWLTAIIISRDVLLVIGLGVLYFTLGKVSVRPRMTGKITTVLQMATVLWILFRWPASVLPYLAYATGVFTVISGVQYILFDGVYRLNAHPSASPSPPKL